MHPHLLSNDFDESLPIVARGEGVYLFDTDGKRYLDGSSGAVTANLGHGNRRMIDAIHKQSELVTFAHRGHLENEPAQHLAGLLSELSGYPAAFLCGSGSEAVEAAMKFALQYWQELGQVNRSRFYSHSISYHGGTLGALSLSGHRNRRRVAEKLLFDFDRLTPPYALRFAHGRSDADFAATLLAEAEQALDAQTDVAGVVIESLGGAAAGAVTAPTGYVKGLARLCAQRGIPLICDEVMTGVGRTGKFLGVDHYIADSDPDLRPDLVVLGKGLGAGYAPISAVLLSQQVLDVIANGSRLITHGHTYAGNPLSSAVGVASLQEVKEKHLVERAGQLGVLLRSGLETLASKHNIVAEVRGLGLLQAMELAAPENPELAIGELTRTAVALARDRGLLIYPATGGINDAVLLAPPLIVTPQEIKELLTLLDEALTAVEDLLRAGALPAVAQAAVPVEVAG